jgi:hypothetical protein
MTGKKQDEPQHSFWRDVGLLVAGAVISLTTSVISEMLHDRTEERNASIAKKMELNHEISKDLGDRYYITYELMKARRTTRDSAVIKRREQEFLKCQEEWNQNVYSYQSLLRNYYGTRLEDNFIRNIYNPLIDLGLEADDTSFKALTDPTFTPKANTLRVKTIGFVSDIYNLAK